MANTVWIYGFQNKDVAAVYKRLCDSGLDVCDIGTDSTKFEGELEALPSATLISLLDASDSRYALLAQLRRLNDAPIVCVGSNPDKQLIKAILEGADAYVSYPINDLELYLRIRNLLERANPSTAPKPTPYESVPGFDIDPKLAASLTETEIKIVSRMMRNPGKLFSHDEIMTYVWGKPVNRGRLRFFVHSLRRKLEAGSSSSLQTQKGVGYRLLPA